MLSAQKERSSEIALELPCAVLFDWDNTLVDLWMAYFKAWNDVLCAFGHKLSSPQEFRAIRNLSDEFASVFPQRKQEALYLMQRFFLEERLKALRPIPGAEKLLRALKSKKIPMGVVSNQEGRALRREVRHMGWAPYFESVVGSQDTPYDKPSEIPLLTALSQMKQSPSSRVWFIGDSELDIECACQAGCQPILVNSTLQSDFFFVQGRNCLGVAKILGSL